MNIPFLYAFVSTQEGEGIVAELLPGLGWHPLITGSESLMEKMKEKAGHIAKATGQKIELRKYAPYEVLEIIEGL